MNSQRPRRSLLATLASLAVASVLLSPASAMAMGGGNKAGAKVDKLCQKISCSESQAKDIKRVFKQMRLDIKPDRQALRELHEQLADEWTKARPSEAELAKLADKINAHERNIADRRMEGMLELHGLLSAEQREQVAAHLMKRGHGKKGDKSKSKSK